MGKNKSISKIVYFDKETIKNILQEKNKGSKSSTKDFSSTNKLEAEIEAKAKINIGIPFLERLSFLFSGKLNTSAIIQRDKSTTITSTEISDFESIKKSFVEIVETHIHDIENSSTFFRVAGGYLKIVKGGVEEVDTKQFMEVMDGFDGYDTYKVDDKRYVRFNNTAFVSNYKRNDLLLTKMDLYCIRVGEFDCDRFDFMKQLQKMESLITNVNENKKLSDIYPVGEEESKKNNRSFGSEQSNDNVELYDVVYACIS